MKKAITLATFLLLPIYVQAETDLASLYLYKYAVELYRVGDTEGAAHELKKCLLVNPDYCLAKAMLKKIEPGLQLSLVGAQDICAKGKSRICPGQDIMFEAGRPNVYNKGDFVYFWDFGDGSRQEGGQRTSHAYRKAGKYTVRVTADLQRQGHCPLDSGELAVYVNSAPVAKIAPSSVCCVGKEAVFDGSPSYDPDGGKLNYFWDLGDGAVSEGKIAVHKYALPGDYTVTLTVSDNSATACGVASASFVATVADKPFAAINVTGQN
jgi:hypothetical protein